MAGRIKEKNRFAALLPLQVMRRHIFAGFAVVLLALAADAGPQSVAPNSEPAPPPTKPNLFDCAIANQKKAEAALDVYERIERVETRKNANDVAPASVRISRVIPSGTGMDRIPVGPDGTASDPVVYRSRLEQLERAIELIVKDSRSQRDALEKFAKRKKDRNNLIDATRNAFLFRLAGKETRGDRTLAKYELEPNPAFRPTSRLETIFTKVHGFVWIDETACELARMEGDVTEDVSVGLFFGKIYKGSHFMQERYEFLPGLWLASFSQYDFDGRKLFSGFSIHERSFYSNYRYIGPPKEALAAIRKELGRGELGKSGATAADP